MAFVTKVDYSDNRQVKQFQLTNTNLSGATEFGLPFSALTSGVDESTVITTGTLANIESTFSGNTNETIFFFDDSRLNPGVETIEPITRDNENQVQVGIGYEGNNSTVIDGNTVNLSYTGATFDLNVTSLTEITPDVFTGTTNSEVVTLLSGGSIDFKSRTIWVDVNGITRTDKLILLDEPEVDNTITSVLARDSEGEIRNVDISSASSFVTGFTYNSNQNSLTIERNGLSDLSTYIDAFSGLTVNGDIEVTNNINSNSLSTVTLSGETIFSGGTDLLEIFLTESDINYTTGATFNSSTGVLEFTDLSGNTYDVNIGVEDYVTGYTFNPTTGDLTLNRLNGGGVFGNLDGRYTLTGHTHMISDITDFPTNVSYFNNDVGYITGFTNTTYTAGVGLELNGTEFTHFDTSSQIDTTNPVGSFVRNIELDDFGHITQIFSGSETDPTVPSHVKNITTGNTNNWTTAYNDKINTISVTGDANKVITLTQQDGTTLTANFEDNNDGSGIDIKINALNFNNTNGILTATRDDAVTVTTTLDGRYSLLGHTHTVSDITNFPTNVSYFNNDAGYITGFTDTTYTAGNGLDLNGTIFSHSDTSTQVSSNNSGRTYIQSIGLDTFGHITNIETSTETVVNSDDYVTGSSFNISTGDLTLNRLEGGNVVENLDGRYSLTGHTHVISDITDFPTDISYFNNDVGYITGFTDTNFYLDNLSFNLSTGILTASVNGTTNQIVDLNGRYALTGHTHTVSDITDFPTDISYFNNDVGYITGFTNTTYTTSVIDSTGDAIIRLSGSDSSTDDITLIGGSNVSLSTSGDTITISGISDDTTYTAGDGLDLNGTEFAHSDTSSQASSNNSGRTYIQNIGLDTFGHITGLTTSSETVINTDDYVTSATFNTTTGDLTLNRLDGGSVVENLDGRYALTGHTHTISDITDFPTDISYFNNDVGYITGFTNTTYTAGSGLDLNSTEFSHSNTSTQSSSNNSGRTYIQSIDLDTFGHITGLTTSSETVINTDDYVTGTTFNVSTGDLTLTRLDGGSIVENLDGRYTLTGHTHTISDITDFPTDVSYFNNDVGYITGFTNTFVTDFTYNDSNIITVGRNNGQPDLSVDVSVMSGLTVNGDVSAETIESTTISATTYLNLPTDDNDYVTDVTFSASTGDLTLTTLSGNTITENLDGRYLELNQTTPQTITNGIPLLNAQVVDFNNELQVVNKAYVDNAVNFIADYYFNDTPDALGGIYYQMTTNDLGEAESLLTTPTLTSGNNQPLFNFITQNELGTDNLNKGVYEVHTHAYKTGTKSVSLYASIYVRTVGGSETLVGTSLNSKNITLTDDEYDFTISIPNSVEINPTDKLVVEFFINVGNSGSNPTVTLGLEGGNNSRVSIPIESAVLSQIFVRQDGTTELKDNWNAGDFNITAQRFDTSGGTSNEWNEAYDDSITGLTVTGSSTKTITLNQRDGTSLSANFIDESVAGGSGDVVTGMTFNDTTGDLNLNTLSGDTITENLDGRYTLTGHTHTISDITNFPTDISYFNNDVGYITGFTDTNFYLDNLSFNTSTGILTASVNGTTNQIVDLNGRYALTGHTHTVSDITDFPTDISYFNNDVGYITGFTDTTYTAGDGLELNGTEFSHSDTSTQTSSNNSGRTYIQSIDLDDFGHITGLTASSETVVNTDDYVTGATFNTSTGDLTLNRLDGGSVVENLDDRYSLTGHTHVISDITDFGDYVNKSGDTMTGDLTIDSNDPYFSTKNAGGVENILQAVGTTEGVVGTITNHPLRIKTNGSNRVTIDSTGNFGIGTDSPNSRLNALAGSVAELKFNSGGSNVTPTLAVGNTNTSGKFAALVAGTSGSLFAFDGTGYFDIASTTKNAYNNNSISGGVSKLRINSNGRIGIGTTAPTEKLEVDGNVKAIQFIGDGSQLTGIPNSYVTGTTFNTSTGDLTLTRNDGLSNITTSLDDRYITIDEVVGEYLPLSGGTLTGGVTGTTLTFGNTTLEYQENNDVDSVATEVIATTPSSNIDAAFFNYVVKKGTNLRAGVIMAVHDGANIEFTDNSTNDLGDTTEVVFDMDLSGGNLRLLADVNTDNWEIKVFIKTI